jgi:hypothetical protein
VAGRRSDHRPDRRQGQNLSDALEDFGLGAFAVFFTQSPSFLAHQKAMQEVRGRHNARSLFGLTAIPGDNQIRQMLDPVPPQALHPVFDHLYDPLRELGLLDALKVNWCELFVTDAQGQNLDPNAFVTDWPITEQNVAARVASARARWKIENENHNTLKTQGYHFEHNFGHGQKHLASLLASRNLLAFRFHTVLGLTDERSRWSSCRTRAQAAWCRQRGRRVRTSA